MARFRHVIQDDQWIEVQKIAAQMHVAPKDLLNSAAAVGLAFFKLSLNPPADLLKSTLKAAQRSPEIRAAANEALRPLVKKEKGKRVK